jgi:threonylcarbamoyladenosine tRNA methylthiotransferase MtaB
MKVSILTLGCKVNQSESTIIEGNLIRNGHQIVSLSEHPDYCVINTCSVTSKSDYRSRQLIRRAVKSGARVIATGCYAQLRPDEIKKIKGVECIINNLHKYNIINVLSNCNESITFNFSCRSRPYVKVQDGCNFSCSYCIIPLARGKSRSTHISDIVQQVNGFESSGYNEIVLTGIHLGLYGYDLKPKTKLSYLIKTLLKETKIKRMRLSSIEVREIDSELIGLLQEQRICKHIHIPLQSGDDTILKLMNRKYTTKDYLKVLDNISKKIPNIAIGTDIIVGFPGEGQKEFLNTRNLIESAPISYMHIFSFSSRQGTVASQMPVQNSFPVKRERVNEMKALNIRKKKAYISSQLNKILDIIIEKHNDDKTMLGTSGNYLKVRIDSKKYLPKSYVNVRVSGIEEDILKGYPLEFL